MLTPGTRNRQGMLTKDHPFDLEIAHGGTTGTVGYMIARDKGAPVWSVDPAPEVATKAPIVSGEERYWNSWHSGYGYRQAIYPNTYYYAVSGDARFPGVLFPGPIVQNSSAAAGDIVGFFEQGSEVWVLDGRYAKKLTFSFGNTTTNDTVTLGSTGTNIQDLGTTTVATGAISFDAVTYVSCSTGNMWGYTGAAWDEKSTTPVVAIYLAKCWNDTTYVLWRAYSTTAVDSIAQGTADLDVAWPGSDYTIGDTTAPITAMAGHEERLFIAKTDGLWELDRGLRTVQVVKAPTVNTNNGKGLYVDSQGLVWYPTTGGLFRYNPNTGEVQDVSPDKGLYNAAGPKGRVTCVAQYRGWYYAIIYNGSDSYLMAAREREADEPGFGPLVWHGSLADIGSTQVTCMFVSSAASSSYPVLLMGATDNKIYFCRLATTDCPLADSNYKYTASTNFYFSYDNWGLPGAYWNMVSMWYEMAVTGSDSLMSMTANLSLDEGTYTGFGTSPASPSSGRYQLTATTDKRFSTASIKLIFAHGNDQTARIMLRSISAQATRRVSTQDYITTTIICDDRYFNHYGIQNRQDAATMITNLKALSTAAPFAMADHMTGVKRSQTVLAQPPRQALVKMDGYEHAVYALQMSFRVLA